MSDAFVVFRGGRPLPTSFSKRTKEQPKSKRNQIKTAGLFTLHTCKPPETFFVLPLLRSLEIRCGAMQYFPTTKKKKKEKRKKKKYTYTYTYLYKIRIYTSPSPM